MSLYEDSLEKEGIATTRSYSLASAMSSLHSAIARLDNRNKEIWLSKTLDERMRDFATVEQLNTRCLQKEPKVDAKHTVKNVDSIDDLVSMMEKPLKENSNEDYHEQRV